VETDAVLPRRNAVTRPVAATRRGANREILLVLSRSTPSALHEEKKQHLLSYISSTKRATSFARCHTRGRKGATSEAGVSTVRLDNLLLLPQICNRAESAPPRPPMSHNDNDQVCSKCVSSRSGRGD
jgi:hypothetical protein